jgi:hypothetical protein
MPNFLLDAVFGCSKPSPVAAAHLGNPTQREPAAGIALCQKFLTGTGQS